MNAKTWSRRQVVQGCAGIAALASLGKEKPMLAQFAPLTPLRDERVSLVTTTESQPWVKGPVFQPTFNWVLLNLNIDPKTAADGEQATMQGFGGCFNERGWVALNALDNHDRDTILRELFHPSEGARFSYCRMPIGANDYATEAYSYDETDGDFALQHFSIEHDRHTLIPFIHAAQVYQPGLRLWASPWSPPAWMKRNHFYAEAKAYPGMTENDIRPDQVGHEGEDMFIQEPRYFEAYARYFGRFIDAYRAEGIDVGMVMPQNEFNSAQNFPSCTWTPAGLARFLERLGPEMQKRKVAVFFGTLERGDPNLFEAVMANPQVAPYIRGIGVQWAGKNALPALHREYPSLLIYQSEQECGDGKNSWSYTSYCWQLMKHYFRSGARAYLYWNLATDHDGMSTWGWAQNSLVSVDAGSKTYHFNHDYYLLKHLTHFVEVGAVRLDSTGTCDDALAFRNPDGSVVALLRNELAHGVDVAVQIAGRGLTVQLPPDSVSTLHVRA